MDRTEPDDLERFATSIAHNLQKNGFPARKVSFPLERMYESAAAKGLSFNKVLDVLHAWGVDHEKTPERIIFSARLPDRESGADPLAGVDLGALQSMSPEQLMQAAQEAARHLSPDQLEALRSMVGGMTPEQLRAMMEQARKLGLG